MLENIHEKNKLLFQYEVLKARLCIREFFLKVAVKEVYENVGQILSLVRMQLAFFDEMNFEDQKEHIVHSGDLVGQSIADLRTMTRSFYPDVDILKEGGFINGISNVITMLSLKGQLRINSSGNLDTITEGLKLFLFNIIEELLLAISKNSSTLKSINVSYTHGLITTEIRYRGEAINLHLIEKNSDVNKGLTINERIELVSGSITEKISKTTNHSIILNIPSNKSFYE